jgi:hypothetical protein
MKIFVGNYVRISSDFSSNRNLQNQTGIIVALPNVEHLQEYLVKLDGGKNSSPHLAEKLVRVPVSSLKLADQIRSIL